MVVRSQDLFSSLFSKHTNQPVPKTGEVVTALDAGGMSVDVITVEIGRDYPLTLVKEVVRPDGSLPVDCESHWGPADNAQGIVAAPSA